MNPVLLRAELDDRGCWLWLGATSQGYGRRWAPKGTTQLVHRRVYELLGGPVPEGMDLDHLCRVRRCINPGHLEPVTRRENLVRGEGRAGTANSSSCRRGHAFRYPPTRPRYCPTCKAAADKVRHSGR